MRCRLSLPCAVVVGVAAGVSHATETPPAPPGPVDAAAVCDQETRELETARRRYTEKHPNVGLAVARAQAACQPAPSADCALARADLAGHRAGHLSPRHPNVVLAVARAEALCAPAPTPACARARADLAEVKVRKLLDRHPDYQEAKAAVERECKRHSVRDPQRVPSPPR